MTASNLKQQTILRDLGDDLLLRRATAADAGALAEFNSKLHSDDGPEQPDERIGAWTADLASQPHPTFNVGDFTIVEDTRNRQIVSSLSLISQTWRYDDIPLGMGRPELVGTLPEYRNRGLVRAQFEVIHQWSAERGEKMLGITGIPYYYRLFGYEMALNLGGGRSGYLPLAPRLKEGEEEPFCIRPAARADLPFIALVYREGSRRSLVTCIWDESLLRYELEGRSAKSVNRLELRIIETPQGEPVGFLAHQHFNWGPMLVANVYELKAGVSWGAVTPSVVRYLYKTGEAYAAAQGDKEPFGGFGFWLGAEHPVYEVFADRLPRVRKPYAWYIRVPDLPDFLRHITPALERRLAASALAGYSGELKITFYRSGLRLAFERGHLSQVEAWQPVPLGHSGNAAFPDLTFLQLLFGYRTLDELKHSFADCWTNTDDAQALLQALFPKRASDVWPVS